MIDHRKKVVLFGMCYMPALATILNLSEEFAANFHVVPYATGGPSPDLSVNFGISDEELSECSVIIYTSLAFPGWGYSEFYENLIRRFPDSALKVSIPYPSFHPLWPFHTSIGTQPRYMEWLYGDVNVQRRVYEGATPQQIVDEYLSLDQHEMTNLNDVLEFTMASDRAKEAETDVKYLDFAFENFRTLDLFSCLNHPSNILMAHMMNQVLDRLAIPRIEDAAVAALPQLLPPAIPIHPSIVRHFGLAYAPPDRKYEIEPGRLMTYAEYLYSLALTCPVSGRPAAPAQSDSVQSSLMALRALAAEAMGSIGLGGSVTAHPAVPVLREIISREPTDFDARLTLARIWMDAPATEVEQSAELPDLIAQCLQLDQNSADAWYLQGMLSQHREDRGSAEAAYRRVLALHPGHVAAQFRLWTMSSDFQPTLVPRSIPEFDWQSSPELPYVGNGDAILLRGVLPDAVVDTIGAGIMPVMIQQQSANENRRPQFDELPDHFQDSIRGLVEGRLLGDVLPHVSKYRQMGWPYRADGKWQVQLHGPAYGYLETPIHSDCPIARRDDFLTFWIPLTPCGPGVAPSLRALAYPCEEPLVMKEWGFGTINEYTREQINGFVNQCCAESFMPVTMMPGDVLVFGRRALHATYTDQTTTENRISCDIRYACGPSAFGSVLSVGSVTEALSVAAVTRSLSLDFLPLVFRHSWAKPPVMFTDPSAVLFYAKHFSAACPPVATLLRALYHDVDETVGELYEALRLYEAWLNAPPDGFGFVCAVGSHAGDRGPVFYICPPSESLEQLSKTEFLIRLSERRPYLFGALFAAARQLHREGRFEAARVAVQRQIERQDHFLLDQALVVLEHAVAGRALPPVLEDVFA